MAESEKTVNQEHPSKKQIRSEVYAKLSEVLAVYKNGTPEEKFADSIKKASKQLAKDFARSEKKSAAKSEKSKKKASAKKAKQG